MSKFASVAQFIARNKKTTLAVQTGFNSYAVSRTQLTVPTFTVQRRYFSYTHMPQQQEQQQQDQFASNQSREERPFPRFKVFVTNLSWNVDWGQLKDFFKVAGEVKFCKVFKTPEGRPKGKAIVFYETEEEANQAIEQLNGAVLDGREIQVTEFREFDSSSSSSQAPPRRPRQNNRQVASARQVFVAKLPFETTEEEIANFFSQSGTVKSVSIARLPDGRSRGFGFVQFETEEEALNAVDTLNGSEFSGQTLFVKKDEKSN